MSSYFRPLVQQGSVRPSDAVHLANGWGWFVACERLERGAPERVVPNAQVPDSVLDRMRSPRDPMPNLDLSEPRIMGILNVTPDSFSDGGLHAAPQAAAARAEQMLQEGAHIIDVGGESTRPGATFVPAKTEIERIDPVIRALRAKGVQAPISIDTRKADVADAACDAGADLINDVSGFTFDPDLASTAVQRGLPVCVMHAQGDPATMQNDPQYEDVLLDVFDWLSARIDVLEQQGIPRSRIIADPGIGFGKTDDHNLNILRRISIFHGLGVAILLGVSRKGFIGRAANVKNPDARGPGSVSVALSAIQQGVQIIRAHDVAEHAQAIAMWRACMA
ncbi:MAG: dihydropteroate synthase [Paracoccaceae bacterium]